MSQRERLTTTGPYTVTRNPFYLGNLILDLGLCTMIGRVEVALPYVVLWLWFHIRKIRDEERDLALLFGEAYAAYKERVPVLIPWRLGNVRRLRAADARSSGASRNLSSRKDIPRFLVALSYPFLFLARHQLAAQGISSLDLDDPLGLCMLLGFLLLQLVARLLRRPLQRRRSDVLAARAADTRATPS